MDKTMEAVLTFAGTAGGSAFLVFLCKGISKWWSGAAHREQVKNTSLATQRAKAIKERDDAEAERDAADELRREAEEHVSILKRQLRENGIEPKKYGSDLRKE
jgi:hypothetical protein